MTPSWRTRETEAKNKMLQSLVSLRELLWMLCSCDCLQLINLIEIPWKESFNCIICLHTWDTDKKILHHRRPAFLQQSHSRVILFRCRNPWPRSIPVALPKLLSQDHHAITAWDSWSTRCDVHFRRDGVHLPQLPKMFILVDIHLASKLPKLWFCLGKKIATRNGHDQAAPDARWNYFSPSYLVMGLLC